MTPPKHEPPDPELWGRVVEMWEEAKASYSSVCLPFAGDSTGRSFSFWLSFYDASDNFFCGTGPTWNDAARALIAEWEGRKK